MQRLGQYALSLVATAMICGILLSFFREGTVKNILRMVCGIMMITAASTALRDLDISELTVISERFYTEGKTIAAMGEDLARDEKLQCIQQRLEAYILDKANALNAPVIPQVKLNPDGLPVEVRLWGQCSDQARKALTAMITNDLGIPEEDQKWTGET